MDTIITIKAGILINPGNSFNYFYLLSMISGLAFMLYIGIRRKYPISTWSVFVLLVATFFLIGLLIFPYTLSDIRNIIFGTHEEISALKYGPRGILFAIFGLIIGKQVLRIKAPIADDLIYPLLIMGIIQRIGCFLNGCCYGTPTSLPWSVSYSSPTFMETHQTGVHPTQLYTIIGYILIMIILYKIAGKLRVNGNLAITGLVLIGLNRFLIEFWREDHFAQYYNAQWGVLSALQWKIIVFCTLVMFIVFVRERFFRIKRKSDHSIPENLVTNITAYTLLLLLIWNMREIFDVTDLILLMLLLGIALGTLLVQLYKKLTVPSYRLLVFMVGLAGIISMGQVATYSLEKEESDTLPSRGWFDVGFGLGSGNYDDISVSRNCEGQVISRDIVHRKHFVANLNVNYNFKPRKNQLLRIGLAGYSFSDQTEELHQLDYKVGVIYPRFSYDFRFVGMGAGIHLPVFYQNNFFKFEHNIEDVYPSFMLRWGPKKYFFGDAAFYWDFHYWGIPAKFQMGAGSGFGKDKFILRIGYAAITEEENLFHMSGEGIINDRFQVKAGFAAGNNIHGFISLNYHIGKNRWKTYK